MAVSRCEWRWLHPCLCVCSPATAAPSHFRITVRGFWILCLFCWWSEFVTFILICNSQSIQISCDPYHNQFSKTCINLEKKPVPVCHHSWNPVPWQKTTAHLPLDVTLPTVTASLTWNHTSVSPSYMCLSPSRCPLSPCVTASLNLRFSLFHTHVHYWHSSLLIRSSGWIFCFVLFYFLTVLSRFI